MHSPSFPPPIPAGTAPIDGVPTSSQRPFLVVILSLVLLLFLGSAIVAFLDHSLILLLHREDLSIANGLILLPAMGASFSTYWLMGLVPAIPRRIFLPVSLFLPLSFIAILPLLIYFHQNADLIAWGVAGAQLLVALSAIRQVQGNWSMRWPLFSPTQFHHDRKSTPLTLLTYLLGTVLLLLPCVALYVGLSAQLAVSHFTDGFVILRPSGISMQVRKYVRADGRRITLVPMSHIGEAAFYHSLASSFPPDSMILMEGVSDDQKLMTTHIDYSRMASATGGVPQVEAFKPKGRIIGADIDMSAFAPETLELLKAAMLFHAKGLTPETLQVLMKPTPPGIEKVVMNDILTKRNHHLLEVIQRCLSEPGEIIVPWGAAHMPEIAREIRKSGFQMTETKEFVAIRFGS